MKSEASVQLEIEFIPGNGSRKTRRKIEVGQTISLSEPGTFIIRSVSVKTNFGSGAPQPRMPKSG